MPFLHFQAHKFYPNILFYNFYMDSIEILQILEVCDVSNFFFSFFQFKSRVERLLQVFFFFSLNFKKLNVESFCCYSWRLKVLVLALECWKFLFLFFKVEGSCSYSCMLNIHFCFRRWKVPNLCFMKCLFAILNKNDLKKSFNFLKSWYVKCDL